MGKILIEKLKFLSGSRTSNLYLVRGLPHTLRQGIRGPRVSGRHQVQFQLRPGQPQLDQHQERRQGMVQL
jgi:hypothetical protein